MNNEQCLIEKRVLEIRNTNLKKNSGYEHPEDAKPKLFRS
jgi:hypothetical protein